MRYNAMYDILNNSNLTTNNHYSSNLYYLSEQIITVGHRQKTVQNDLLSGQKSSRMDTITAQIFKNKFYHD